MSSEPSWPPDTIAVTSQALAPTVVVVRPRGDVDTTTVGRLRGELADRVAAGARHVVLDLGGVDFLGSAGLAMLVEQREAAVARDGALRLAAVPRTVLRPLQITGLAELFEIHDDVDEAARGLV